MPKLKKMLFRAADCEAKIIFDIMINHPVLFKIYVHRNYITNLPQKINFSAIIFKFYINI